jgi:hypothetical protein
VAAWGTVVEVERRNRIRVLLWAYAYEILDRPLVDDAKFDEVCAAIDVSVNTGRYDEWFRAEFNPSTGLWIHHFPDLNGIRDLYRRVYGGK